MTSLRTPPATFRPWLAPAAVVVLLLAAAPALAKTIVLPWIAQSRGPLVQSSDLYLLNPGTDAMTVTLTFRQRGAPESNPPRATRTVAAGATLYVADVASDLFDRENVAGVLVIDVDGGVDPLVSSSHNLFAGKNRQVSRAGVPAQSDAAEAGQSVYLVGLRQDSRNRTSLSLYDLGSVAAFVDVVFLALDGTTLGTLAGVTVEPGASLVLDSTQLPLPAGARTGGFQARVDVHRGSLHAAAQVLNRVTNDPAYVQGETR